MSLNEKKCGTMKRSKSGNWKFVSFVSQHGPVLSTTTMKKCLIIHVALIQDRTRGTQRIPSACFKWSLLLLHNFWGHSWWTLSISDGIPTKLGAVLLKGLSQVFYGHRRCAELRKAPQPGAGMRWNHSLGKRLQQPFLQPGKGKRKAGPELRCGAARTGWTLWQVPGELFTAKQALSQVIMAL